MARDTHVAIIGDGIAALITFGVLRHEGLPAEAITIYGDSPHPLAVLERLARAIGQENMRSESSGHLSPVDFPGLALVDAWRRRSPWPLVASLFDAYNPSLDLLLEHSRGVARQAGFEQRRVTARVGRIGHVEPSALAFAIFDEAGEPLGRARHVILAVGIPGLAWPPEADGWRDHPRVAHAYQSPEMRAGERVVILGGGMTAAHLWQAALQAGATVMALCLSPPRHQPLNAPRCYFSTVGVEEYRRLDQEQRLAFLAGLRHGSIPWRLDWEWSLWRASRGGRFHLRIGKLDRIEQSHAESFLLHLADGGTTEADRLICATGVQSDPLAHPLLARLDSDYHLPIADNRLLVSDDFTLPPLSRPDSLFAVVGSLARYALPVAETFFGMKYAARRLAPLLRSDSPLPSGDVSRRERGRG